MSDLGIDVAEIDQSGETRPHTCDGCGFRIEEGDTAVYLDSYPSMWAHLDCLTAKTVKRSVGE